MLRFQFSGTIRQVPLSLMEVKDTFPYDKLCAYQCKLYYTGHKLMFCQDLLNDFAGGVAFGHQRNSNLESLEKPLSLISFPKDSFPISFHFYFPTSLSMYIITSLALTVQMLCSSGQNLSSVSSQDSVFGSNPFLWPKMFLVLKKRKKKNSALVISLIELFPIFFN